LSDIGLGKPEQVIHTRPRGRGHGPTIDRGLVAAIRKVRIEVVPAVERFAGPDVVLAGGLRVRPDVVIAATGERTGLEELVGDVDVLLPNCRPRHHGGTPARGAPGLHFIGYRTSSG